MLRAIGKCKLSETHTICICVGTKNAFSTDTHDTDACNYSLTVCTNTFGVVNEHRIPCFWLSVYMHTYVCGGGEKWAQESEWDTPRVRQRRSEWASSVCCENALMSSRFSTENSKKEWQRQAATTTITMTNHRMKCNSQYSLYRDSILSLPLCCIVARNAVFSYSIINLFRF